MNYNSPINLNHLGLYNPQRANDKNIKQLFIARKKEFAFLMKKISQEKKGTIPQHHLIIALRGMGKSTLLKRIEVELREVSYQEEFIPLLFPEEQYNLFNLGELWLNSLETLSDTLEAEQQGEIVSRIDQKVQELSGIRQADILSRKAHHFLKAITSEIGRRPVLLIDNLNLVFDRLSKADQHRLRAWLMEKNAPILIGASAVSIKDTHDYGAPFYDAFQIHYLSKLSFEALLNILKKLAILTQSEEIIPKIHQEIGRLKTIHDLTGGNLRTTIMLFRLIIKGFSQNLNDDLEAILDEMTPLYKARFEALSPSQQKIVDAIALHWDPINLGDLRQTTRLENNQLSPQLKRLYKAGWIEKLNAYQAKGHAYQISERFFNLWFLMRRSNRRKKQELYCLSCFLESFYGEHLQEIAKNRLSQTAKSADYVAFDLAIANTINDKSLQQQLKHKSTENLQHLAMKHPDILNQFDWSKTENVIKESPPIYGKNRAAKLPKIQFLLKQVLIALKQRNEGIATTEFIKVLNYIKDKLPLEHQKYWIHFAKTTKELGYTNWLLQNMASTGYDKILAPYYVAIGALNEKDTEVYLNSKAVEIREPAKKILEMI